MSPRARIAAAIAAMGAALAALPKRRARRRVIPDRPDPIDQGAMALRATPARVTPVSLGASSQPTTPTPAPGRDVGAILKLIRRAEAGAGGYDAISSHVALSRRPSKPLTQMSVGAVLDWQRAIDRFQNSEAAGAYQIMEVTLGELVGRSVVRREAFFNKATQDRLALALMERRGLRAFLAGTLSHEAFARNLAREWAGLPVLVATQGHVIRVQAGQSYYTRVSGNRATVSTRAFRNALGGTPA